MAAVVRSINIYPIKSLDGVSVTEARIVERGALAKDRRWALVDHDGKFIHAKRSPGLQRIRAQYDLAHDHVEVTAGDRPTARFHLMEDQQALAHWLSETLGQPVAIIENSAGGFPDDTESSGPTVISTGTIETVATWFQLDPDEIRRRFRPNIEVADVSPFWEDHLFTPSGTVPFQIGTVRFNGTNPCQRCVVPTRDSQSGETLAQFTKTFTHHRQATLPVGVARERFDHFYRLSLNTNVGPDGIGQVIHVGDPVTR